MHTLRVRGVQIFLGMEKGVCCFNCGVSRRLPEAGATSSDPLFRCSRCNMAFYCCQTCQKSDWPQHKKVCKPVKIVGAQSDKTLMQVSGKLPSVNELLVSVEDPLCVTRAGAKEMGGATAELVLLLRSHGLPKSQLPPNAYPVISKLLAAGADPSRDLRVFPDTQRGEAEAAAQRLAQARAQGESTPETSHLQGERRPWERRA